MYIKTGKGEFQVANWMLLIGLIVADNMYANHCKKKSIGDVVKTAAKSAEKLKAES